MQAVSLRVMKWLLRTIIVCLSIFTFLSKTEITDAGPFGDFFAAIRKSFARPTPQPRPPQSHRSSRKQNNETPPSDAPDDSNSQASPSPTPVPAPPNQKNVRVA